MAELELALEDAFQLAAPSKSSGLCVVKFCRKKRKRGRKLCHGHHMELWRRRNPCHAAWATLRDRSKRKKLPFMLTYQEFFEIAEATGYLSGRGRSPSSLTLDRIDPRLGYALGNVRVITCAENSRKGSYERRVQLSNGFWMTLHEIGYGVSTDDDWRDPDFIDPNNTISWDQPF